VERIIKEHEEKAKEGFERGDRKDLTGILLEIFKDPAAEIRGYQKMTSSLSCL
jgi:hypothetical protein